jgi:hypothetical protein
VLGTQETFCIVIAGLLERDNFDLFLPEFDKPWVIHLRETCCCSINLYTWRPNTIYKNRSVCKHQCQTETKRKGMAIGHGRSWVRASTIKPNQLAIRVKIIYLYLVGGGRIGEKKEVDWHARVSSSMFS